jgi:putative tryptophan/tyrosine transport system substrate-binding protein
MRRRQFITLLGCTAATWPLAARGQQADRPTIGYFSGRSADAEARLRDAFRRGLEESGYVEGRNVAVEYRFSDGQDGRLPALAADLVRQRVAVLVATDTPSALVAKAATTTIPIVLSSGTDPVKLGLVDAVNRPGGNATGVGIFVTDLLPKRLQLLREVVPHAKQIAFIVNLSTATGQRQQSEMQTVAETLGQQLLILSASTEQEVDEAFATIAVRKVDAIMYSANVFFQVVRDRLVSLAARHAIPAIYEWPEFVTAGGLMSYSSSRLEAGRQIGLYTGRILKGAKPGELPIELPSRFEFLINLKTARTLNLTIPPGLLALADEVIE